MLGRYIASNEDDFYDRLPGIDHDEAAARYNVRTQHEIERACAHGAHVFTTVSQITAEECTSLLGRTPDVITPNGLTISRYNVGHDFQTFHADFKERMHAFTMGYFFPNYTLRPRPHAVHVHERSLRAAQQGLRPVPRGAWRSSTPSSRPRARRHGRVLHHHVAADALAPPAGAREARRAQRAARSCDERSSSRSATRCSAARPRASGLHLDDLVDEYWQLRYRRTQAAFRMDDAAARSSRTSSRTTRSDPVLAHAAQARAVQPRRRPGEGRLPPGVHRARPTRSGASSTTSSCAAATSGCSRAPTSPGATRRSSAWRSARRRSPATWPASAATCATRYPTTTAGASRCCARRGRSFHDAAADLTERLLAVLPALAPRPRRAAQRGRAPLVGLRLVAPRHRLPHRPRPGARARLAA